MREIVDSGYNSTEAMNRAHINCRKSAINIYENQFSGSDGQDMSYVLHLTKLRDQIDEEFQEFIDINNDNKRLTEMSIESYLEQLMSEFKSKMSSNVESVESDQQFMDAFETEKTKTLNKFENNFKTSDKSLIESKTKDLKKELNKTLNEFVGKLTERKSRIANKYESKVNEWKSVYIQVFFNYLLIQL